MMATRILTLTIPVHGETDEVVDKLTARSLATGIGEGLPSAWFEADDGDDFWLDENWAYTLTDEPSKAKLLADVADWEADRAELRRRDAGDHLPDDEPDGPTPDEWYGSDDRAVELLREVAAMLADPAEGLRA